MRVTNSDSHLHRVCLWHKKMRQAYKCLVQRSWTWKDKLTFWPVPQVLLQGLHLVHADQLTEGKIWSQKRITRNKKARSMVTESAGSKQVGQKYCNENWCLTTRGGQKCPNPTRTGNCVAVLRLFSAPWAVLSSKSGCWRTELDNKVGKQVSINICRLLSSFQMIPIWKSIWATLLQPVHPRPLFRFPLPHERLQWLHSPQASQLESTEWMSMNTEYKKSIYCKGKSIQKVKEVLSCERAQANEIDIGRKKFINESSSNFWWKQCW